MSKNTVLKSTIHLPRTSFPMKADLPRREPEVLDWWDRIDLYGRIREARSADPPFVLHDGPPYASGQIHLGHALNKILKDFVVKSRSMSGRRAHYVPGWDCHGLPIEHRVDQELGPEKLHMDPLDKRRRCREYAEHFISVQRSEFRRLGVLWDHGLDAREQAENLDSRQAIYRTLDRTYESEVLRQLGRFFVRGAVVHGVKPVHWCTSCRTALAEAEVEYADRVDPSIYVKLPVKGLEERIPELSGRSVVAVIWTTTPWTLPANLAVALHPDLPYVATEVAGETWIVAEGLLERLRSALVLGETHIVARFSGRQLVGEGSDWVGAKAPVEKPYRAPAGPAAGDGVLVLGEHVTLEAGTGCVHTAPGHGTDDYRVGARYGLEPFNPVGDDGCFLAAQVSPAWLAGAFVLEANAKIVEDLEQRGLLVKHEPYPHSYPHCWRCRNPVLFRATPQWFISMEANGLRAAALSRIRECAWHPASGEERIAQMIATRPDWCISRQRTWGVPIPAVVCEPCWAESPDAFLRDQAFFDHLERLFRTEGSDAWFGAPGPDGSHRAYASHAERLARLVPEGVACPRCGGREGLRFHEHIVDVWFESGVSHSAVLGRDGALPWPADLYLEGHDQYRGWFHSSLLVAVNDRGQAPYRQVVTHGFTLDGEGRKMSKSLGNVISPQDVTAARGAEILRLWVSMIDFLEDMRLSTESLDRNAEAYRKIRNTFRYLLGNLQDFDPSTDVVPYTAMQEIDRFALQRLDEERARWLAAYERHEYHVVYHGAHNFCSSTLSSFYLDILKDRLYTLPQHDPRRRSAQTALHVLARDLSRLLAPILCFTTEEVWQELESLSRRPAWGSTSIHAVLFPPALAGGRDAELLARWDRLVRVREEINKALEQARRSGIIQASLGAEVVLSADGELIAFLRSFGDELRFLLITSEVSFGEASSAALRSEVIPGLAVEVRPAPGEKCERCWNYTTDVGGDAEWPGICSRCSRSVREILSETGAA